MRDRWLLVGLASAAAAAVVIACVGDDPIPGTTPTTDAGGADTNSPADDSGSNNDAGKDATAQIPFADVSAGEDFACAVRIDGSVVCWGYSAFGQTGQPSAGGETCGNAPCRLPTVVPGITNAAKIASGPIQSCVVTTAGKVLCWGANDDGVLGRALNAEPDCGGGHSCSPTPKEVAGVVDAVGVAVARSSACAWTAAGAVTCWGHNRVGALARGNHTDEVLAPGTASALTGSPPTLLAGNHHTISQWCAARLDGTVSCWGRNTVSEIGKPGPSSAFCTFSGFSDTGTYCVSVPQTVKTDAGANVTPVSSIAATDGATCVSAGPSVYCWGANGHGIAASNNPPSRELEPYARPEAAGLSALSGTFVHVCGIDGTGDVKCWGENNYANLGIAPNAPTENCVNGKCASTPVTVTLPPGVKAKKVVAAVYASYVLTPEGKLYAWGHNQRGQLGHLPRSTENQCTEPCNPAAEEVLLP